jgi:type IV secretory pathway component VirB8
MELIIITILSVLMPIMTITAFVVGYNCNAPKKILKRSKKRKPTEDELMLERIDKATV